MVALEGKKFGVTCNAVAPVAKTRMTDDIEAIPEEFAPEEVSPLVAWLGSEEAEGVTGRIFGAHGSHYFEYVTETTPGVEIEGEWEPAQVGERFDEITEMPEPEGAGADAETAQQVAQLFEALLIQSDDLFFIIHEKNPLGSCRQFRVRFFPGLFRL